jgi:hypothetical protein
MISAENLKVTGKLNITVTSDTGQVKDSRELDNLVVLTGLTYIASRMKDATKTAMTHIGIGDGITIAASGNTNLLGTNKFRKILTSTTEAASSISYVASFGTADNITGGAITEAGIFNSGTDGSGDMLCRTTFPVVNKGANDTMTITWTINLAAV